MAQRIVIDFAETFRQTYRDLPEAIQKKVQKQLRFLSHDPSHRSLHIRKLNDEWEFYVDVHYLPVVSHHQAPTCIASLSVKAPL